MHHSSMQKQLTPSKEQQRAFQQARCRTGNHVMLASLTPGERNCCYCDFTTYCPQCTPNYPLPKYRRTFALECLRHREVRA